ncbi:hypothetical protein [Sphingomonas sp.]|uniref:hypothetical protein n=1 Tax=Sphingomonas sp. TaxID=28214 RepID=UPI001B1E464B|nr:hypothetical protein [Sphingomonas sp.]MBO9714447.1 hypothetical protein [Sphingomonas sp.]
MELTTSRWGAVRVAILPAIFLSAMVATMLEGSRFGSPAMLTVLLGLPALGYLLPPRVLARIDGQTLWVGARSARIPDLVGIHTHTIRVNFVPASRTMIFSFRSREGSSSGVRKLSLSVRRAAGGLKAAEAFAGLVTQAAGGRIVQADTEPEPAFASRRAAAVSEPEEHNDGFDPDAVIARYMQQKASTQQPEPAAGPARPSFGRKGL